MQSNYGRNKNWEDIRLYASKEMDILEYLRNLKLDLEQRYPEKTIEQNGEISCILDKVIEMFQVSFPNEKIMKDIEIYLEEVRKAVYFYGESLQWMDLEESGTEKDLERLLYPNMELNKSLLKQDHRFANLVWECSEIEFLTQLRALYYQIYE